MTNNQFFKQNKQTKFILAGSKELHLEFQICTVIIYGLFCGLWVTCQHVKNFDDQASKQMLCLYFMKILIMKYKQTLYGVHSSSNVCVFSYIVAW